MVNDNNDETWSLSGGDRPEHLAGIKRPFGSASGANKELTDKTTVMKRRTVGAIVIIGS